MTTASDLRDAALDEFATVGYHAASIQAIAQRAGVSKASVLYHFASKEALLDAALSPAIDELESLIPRTLQLAGADEERQDFLRAFVDFLLRHRRAAQVLITQSGSLSTLPIVVRAQELMQQIAHTRPESSVDDDVRFAVALGGAAYLLSHLATCDEAEVPSDADLRAALIRVLGELLAPVADTTGGK